MNKFSYSNSILGYGNSIFEELFALESLLKLTKEACLKQEINSNYYGLDDFNKVKLSEERNHYLNLLTIAIDKIDVLKEISQSIEKEAYLLK